MLKIRNDTIKGGHQTLGFISVSTIWCKFVGKKPIHIEEDLYIYFKILLRAVRNDFFHCALYPVDAVSVEIH